MVSAETPLADVAHFLAPETADLIVHAPPWLQELVLHSVKWTLIGFESMGPLDPITLQETLHDFVVSILVDRSPDE